MSNRRDVGDAFRAYVRGHDRVWEYQAKFGDSARNTSAKVEFGGLPSPPRFGIAVPKLLEFQRGPDIWRSHNTDARNSSDD